MSDYRPSSDFISWSNRRARGQRYSLNLDNALRPYAQGARAREIEEGRKPMCITCGKEKTITNDFAICWDCVKARRGTNGIY